LKTLRDAVPRLSDLLDESQMVQVAGVSVTYNPQALSVARVEERSQLDETSAKVGHVRSVLSEIITGWISRTTRRGAVTPAPSTRIGTATLRTGLLDLPLSADKARGGSQ
jgi:hypothetical protein